MIFLNIILFYRKMLIWIEQFLKNVIITNIDRVGEIVVLNIYRVE